MADDVLVRVDVSALARWDNMIAAAGDKAPRAIRSAVAWTGDKGRTQVKRALVQQTGLKFGFIGKFIKVKRPYVNPKNAGDFSFSYEIHGKGSDLPLKYFRPKQNKVGVRAYPRNVSTLYEHAFMGPRPGVVAAKLRGHVWKRTSDDQFPIELQKSGINVAEELVKGDSRKLFLEVANRDLPDRLTHDLLRLL